MQQQPGSAQAPSAIDIDIDTSDHCASLVELTACDEPALVIGRRNAVAMLADILVASDDMNS